MVGHARSWPRWRYSSLRSIRIGTPNDDDRAARRGTPRPRDVRAPGADPLPLLHPTSAAPALVADGATVSHRELAARVASLVEQLPATTTGRRLVHLPLTRRLDDVVAHLAVLAAGHVALVTGPEATSITGRFAPDLRLHAGEVEVLEPQAQHLLHPDLALLLSTSGSTGSPKLVRLSRDNVLSNATGIARALGLRSDDRAITSLPLHYCYGLSVMHSVLHAGAASS
ncbi:AMP-binding protein [Janibacter hoylei]|nr:AMP-binding protein [Janibacter hoylei]MCW4602448.1 AMP-binding protein [Janibacter hoylei]